MRVFFVQEVDSLLNFPFASSKQPEDLKSIMVRHIDHNFFPEKWFLGLGLAISTLSQWVQDYKKEGGQSFSGKGQVKPHEEELRVLRKELTHVRQERDILKKAVAIFSGPQGKGTSL